MEEKESTTIRRAVINKAIGFIFDNIEEEITVDDVAKHCGYKPGIFTHVIENAQVYDRHVDNAKEILNRTPVYSNTRLVLDTNKTNFYDFTVDDFKLVDYPRNIIEEVNPQLKFDLGI